MDHLPAFLCRAGPSEVVFRIVLAFGQKEKKKKKANFLIPPPL